MYNNPYNYNNLNNGMNFATNPYYQPYYQQQMQQTQPQTQNTQQPQATQQQVAVNTNKIYVNGLNDVKTKVQYANSDMFYIDNDNPNILYNKIVDATGHYEVKTFNLTEYKPIESQNQVPVVNDLSNYVLKADLEPLKAEITSLNDKIAKMNIKKQIDDLDKKE